MGAWDREPWANDSAADWFGDLMDSTSLREQWLAGISADPEEEFEVVRAGAWLFIQLGRTYVWPIENLDDDLERAIAALYAVRGAKEVAEDDELVDAITIEIAELESRR
ncbi:hypothetical protein ELQ90_16420 [Labedella phragmitis]|uniref:DUF4259 domain-containing protein n=1 Tax=Labedella phragmitis TaxID=2498849 RepID=A0A444PNU9_9MICO|nr:hypothetical protein [Labedella phragmitis]RWZ45976.1 hypothetical protein ELQ90_16420 [Labedella phragmitis]